MLGSRLSDPLAEAKAPLAEYFQARKKWPSKLDEVAGDGGTNWTCKPGTMPAKNLPAACRN